MRGLKLAVQLVEVLLEVAPYVGAWIETRIVFYALNRALVAPYVGAWIETGLYLPP